MFFTAYVLSEQSHTQLLAKFSPKYTTPVAARHIIVERNVAQNMPPPTQPTIINVYGHYDSGNGTELLIVSVDGKRAREDGAYFHILWSYNGTNIPDINDHNHMLAFHKFKLIKPIPLSVNPALGAGFNY